MIEHRHPDEARSELLGNMYKFSPEAHFFTEEGSIRYAPQGSYERTTETRLLHTKACNRCARFLPINVDNERFPLSFSNHCVAAHRRPCSHTGFGTLRDIKLDRAVKLEYGFQLECGFCKKFTVNAAHNPQRTAAQMKEDSARRRAFELLLVELLDGSPQLRYRHETGRELAEDIFERFGGKCFKCGAEFESRKEMHLDHTRPLALLWPLDGTATALCASCNSAKRDRAPVDFYTEEQLGRLSVLTGLSREELRDPGANVTAINRLLVRLEWLATDFLRRPDVAKAIVGGKDVPKLVVRALQKAINRGPKEFRVDLQATIREIESLNSF